MLPYPQLLPELSRLCGRSLAVNDFISIVGGSINEVYKVNGNNNRAFVVKVNSATKFPQLFAQEVKSLQALQQFITTPTVVGLGEMAGYQLLVMEWIQQEAPTPAFWESFGAALAGVHAQTGATFGGCDHNYMGAVPQDNGDTTSWTDFFAQRRLLPLARQCGDKGLLGKTALEQVAKVANKLPDLFSEAPPSLLHGDLWSGNFLCGRGGLPVVIDPAVYYGHSSVDLAMTTLFGGFDPLFYEAYHYHKPLPNDYKIEWEICNLYPLLIHLLLFGRSYLPPIQRTLERFAGTQHRIV